MKVKDLIYYLSTLPENLEVYRISGDYLDSHERINQVEHIKQGTWGYLAPLVLLK